MGYKQRKKRIKHQKRSIEEHVVAGLLKSESIIIDRSDKKYVIVTNDVLINHLKRDSQKIQDSFDRLCDSEIAEISKFTSTISSLILAGMMASSKCGAERKNACGALLVNAMNSLFSATQLLRLGFVLQPGIILRSVLESISTVCHLIERPDDFEKYKDGKLQSTKTIAAAKKVIPPFGHLYAKFSDDFAHIGVFHREIQPVKEYDKLNDALSLNLSFIRLTSWLLYVVVELLYHELLDTPRYWIEIENGFMYKPSQSELDWLSNYLK